MAIIDMRADAFRRLPSDFTGQKITGVGFDRDTLSAAGVADAYGFAAVSDGDNSNILAARVVRETYGVENVVARIADSGRAEVYRRLGIPTVAPVPWTASQIVTRLLPGGSQDVYTDTDAKVSMKRLTIHEAWVGRKYSELEEAAQARVAYVSRFGKALIPMPGVVIQADDDAFVVLTATAARKTEKIFSRPPGVSS